MSRRQTLMALTIGIGALAFLLRILSVMRGGGLLSMSDYDSVVYYTGADSLIAGRVPYADFVLLHPPGILVVLAPFAALGHLFSDSTGYAVARVAFMAVGALNAVMLTRLAGRLGLVAAAVAGVFYAVWNPSMYADRTTLLEPLGTTALLVTLLLLLMNPQVTSRTQLIAGAAIGLGATVKIWGVIPILVIVLWQWRADGVKAAARIAAGATAAIAAVCLPFFLLAPGPMFRMVILDQLERPVIRGSIVDRLGLIGSLHVSGLKAGSTVFDFAVLGLTLALAVASALTWRLRPLRIVVVLLAAMGAVLLASPSYFLHYAEFVAAPVALIVAYAFQQIADWARSRHLPVRLAAGSLIAAPLAVLVVGASSVSFGSPVAWANQDTVADIPGCVYSDDPSSLIAFNVLSSDLRRGCHVWVDMTGLTYEPTVKRPVSRLSNPVWQRDLIGYLSSGSAAIILRHPAAKLDYANNQEIREGRLLARTTNYSIFAH
ncbi:MAG: hypothetical protein JWR83_3019 [Aeromicrobium sp.]|nr:hypothetical protein [Aeromicrobium sp.]